MEGKKCQNYLLSINENLDSAIVYVTSALDSLQVEKVRIVEALANNQIFESSLFSNSMEPFAMKFGMALYGEDKWLEMEIIRQLYKTFEQRIGEFHQFVLGGVVGWVDLKAGAKHKLTSNVRIILFLSS